MEGFVALFVILLLSFILPGVINRTRAVLSGRRGVTMYQHLHNVELLFRKGAVYSRTTTALFRIVPSVCLGATFVSLLLLPLGSLPSVISFNGDVVLFCYLFALCRFAMIIAAMDTGSSFEGMGASREALYGALVEPALFAVMGTLALVTGRTSFSAIFSHSGGVDVQMIIVMLLLAYTMFNILIVEAGRIPLDDPRTHLELTMIHEVMILDYCGVDLAYITVAGWFKMGALALLAANSVAASAGNSIFLTVGTVILTGVVVGVVESFRARNKLSRNTTYVSTILAIALLVFFVALLLTLNISI